MSTDMSVPRPRLPGVDVSDSALLASLLNEAPVGFAFIGPDSRFLRMNRVMAALTGGADADRAGLTPAQIWPPDLAEAAAAALRRVAAGDQPAAQTVHAIAAADPDTVPQVRNWSFSWFPSGDGDVSGLAAIAVDVTPQHQAAEAVRRSEERYRSLVQAGAQVVWVTKPDGEIAEDSPEWRWIT
jgi:PAS domain S-box-containing protein